MINQLLTTNQPDPSNEIVAHPEPSKKLVPIVFLSVVLLFIGSVTVLAYNTFFTKSPSQNLLDSFKKLLELESFRANFESPADSFKITGEALIHKEGGQASSVKLKAVGFKENLGESANLNLILTSREVFLGVYYSAVDDLLYMVNRALPGIGNLDAYQLTVPVISGDKYLKFNLPQESRRTSDKSEGGEAEADREDLKRIRQKFSESLTLRKKEAIKNGEGGKAYERFVFGLKKEKMIEALNAVKDSNLELRISEVNALIKIVESSDDWDEDLLIILIDKKSGYPAEISLSLPSINPEALEQSLTEILSDKPGLFSFKKLPFFGKLGTGTKNGKPVNVGTLKFSDFGKAQNVEIPQNVVTFEELAQAALRELPPLMTAILQASDQSLKGLNFLNPTKDDSKSTATSSASSKVEININQFLNPNKKLKNTPDNLHPTALPYPTTAPGSPGSYQWMDEFWSSWEEMGKNIEQKQKEVEETQRRFCEENPDLCQ